MDKIRIEQKTYKSLMILSMIFFIGFGLFGFLSIMLLEDGFWEKSTLLTIIGAIIGFILIISMISLIFVAITTIKPYKTTTNYLKFIQVIILIFVFDTIISDVLKSETLSIVLFGVIGLFIVTANTFAYIRSKSLTEESITNLSENYMKEIREQITNDSDGVNLFNLYIIVIMALLLINYDLSSIVNYLFLVLVNSYILYKYFKATRSTRKQIYIYCGLSIVSTIIAITLLLVIKEFIELHIAIQVIIFTAPSNFLLPRVLKNYYQIVLKQSYEPI